MIAEQNARLTFKDRTGRTSTESDVDISNALQLAKLGHWEFDIEKDLFRFTDEFYAIYHTTAERVGGYTMSSGQYKRLFVHPDDWNSVAMESRDQNYSQHLEHRMLYSDGTIGYVAVHFRIINDSKGHIIKTFGVNQDITERKKAELALQDSVCFFSQMFEQSGTSTCLYDPQGTMINVNPKFCNMFGVDPQSVTVGKYNVFEDRMVQDAGIVPLLQQIFDKKEANHWEFVYNFDLSRQVAGTTTSKTGMLYLEVFGHPILDKDGNLKYVVLQHYDITERKQASEKIRKSEEKLTMVLNGILTPVVYIDSSLRYIFVNKAYTDWYCESRENIEGKYIRDLLAEDVFNRALPFYQAALSGQQVYFENPTMRKGEKKFVRVRLVPHQVEDKVVGFFSSIMDITELKQTGELLKSALKEKETLLHETHHRVKNNMTVISSLLGLQLSSITDKKACEALQDCQNRVQAMSMIHEILTHSDNQSSIDMGSYLYVLCDFILKSHSASADILMKTDIDDVMININQATPVGLIVSELITNSIKYAFPDSVKGQIDLKLRVSMDNIMELTLSDNGIGLPKGFKIDDINSLGLKLVKSITEQQLGGSIYTETECGARFTIKFDLNANK
ncbi:PAS domain S-box protein [bacterium]|nr:PAS domain S-box protein [bacterium]